MPKRHETSLWVILLVLLEGSLMGLPMPTQPVVASAQHHFSAFGGATEFHERAKPWTSIAGRSTHQPARGLDMATWDKTTDTQVSTRVARQDKSGRAISQKSPPKEAETYSKRGVARSLLEFELAMADFAKALELNPRYEAVYLARAALSARWAKAETRRVNLGFNMNWEELCTHAIADYTKALDLHSTNVETYLARAAVYTDCAEQSRQPANYDQAVADYTKAIEIVPTKVAVYLARAVLYADRLGSYARAIADYTKALELAPRNVVIYLSRAGVYVNWAESSLKPDYYSQAIADFTKALELAPQSATIYRQRAVIYAIWAERENNPAHYAHAIADATKALERAAHPEVAAYLIAVASEETGRIEKALVAYREVLSILQSTQPEQLSGWYVQPLPYEQSLRLPVPISGLAKISRQRLQELGGTVSAVTTAKEASSIQVAGAILCQGEPWRAGTVYLVALEKPWDLPYESEDLREMKGAFEQALQASLHKTPLAQTFQHLAVFCTLLPHREQDAACWR